MKKLAGGKHPVKLVEEFITKRGFDPNVCLSEKTADTVRWMLKLGDEEELEVLVEGLTKPAETTIYMGVNIATVPIRGALDMLVSALEIADGLVGIKVSLVGHFLVLSASLGLSGVSVDDLEYNYNLIEAQQAWFKNALSEELGLENFSEE
ncbi:MAG: hypothetical protein ACOX2O_05120 [Bdellovibrionota bacterium]